MAHTATCILQSLAPYSASKPLEMEKPPKEDHGDWERRIWPEKGHYSEDGFMQIPAMAFKGAIAEAAGFLGEKIKGRRGATWKKHFEAGVQVLEPLTTEWKKEKVPYIAVYCHADGKRTSGTRVMRYFPQIPHWRGEIVFHILDELITEDVFLRHLKEAGNFIGVGRFRCINRGMNGRFKVVSCKWK